MKNGIELFKDEKTVQKFNEILGKRGQSFVTSVISIISQSDMLKNADPKSIYLSAMVSATLDLPINPNLGFAYILPYNSKDGTKASFQMGYKGFIQLALRSGQFKTISSSAVYEGQITSADPLTGYEFDWTVKKNGEPIGYVGYFRLLNGFEKYLYMTIEDLKNHGTKFSQTFRRGYGLWKDNFEAMATKTVIKLILSKYAPLSVEMQKAIIADQGVIEDENLDEVSYLDNQPEKNTDDELEEKLKNVKEIKDDI